MTRLKLLTSVVLIVLGTCAVALAVWSLSGFSSIEVTLTLTCLFLGLAQLFSHIARVKEREEGAREIEDLGQAASRLAGDLQSNRSALQSLDDEVRDTLQGHDKKMVKKMQALETLIQQMATGSRDGETAAADTPGGNIAGTEADNVMAGRVRAALEAGKLDVYLQPVVTLPQRKTRFYELSARLRDDGGRTLAPEDYLRAAHGAGLMPALDNIVFMRAIRVIRDLRQRNEDVGLICRLSVATLGDAEFFSRIHDDLTDNADLASILHLEFGQPEIDRAGPLERESLEALGRLGFGFMLCDVEQLDIDFKALSESGFTSLKLDAGTLLGDLEDAQSPVQADDLPVLLRRHGIELIIAGIDDERVVANVLDYDVAFGLGSLFSEPKPVNTDDGAYDTVRRTASA